MNQQQSNKRGHFYSIILALIIGLIGTAWSLHHPRPEPEQAQLPQAGEGLSIYMLPAGDGQCILMTCGETAADFLRSQKVRRIDLLVSSNPDDQYIGGLPTIIKNYPVRNVWTSSATSDAFADAVKTAGITPEAVSNVSSFELGDAVITPRFVYGSVFCLDFAYGETSGAVGFAPDQEDALQPVLPDDVTVYVSDGEQICCLTEAGD